MHLDIVKERLFREFDIDVIMTAPQVTYRIKMAGDKTSEYARFGAEIITISKSLSSVLPPSQGEGSSTNSHLDKGGVGGIFTYVYISNPEDLPDREKYISIEEPIAKVEIITPSSYI
ncbi:MAG: hypothetical protein LBQ24_03320 [Candidatus Peribacteria bacterium]|nr:hypothetical protein [Candidatus Peribacteria bacterium]